VGNDANVTFALSGVGTGSFLIAIYENAYRLLITQPAENEEDPPIVLFDETRDKAYLGFNIACGGDCPSRTDFACECEGLRRCYFDDDNGTISKIFEGTKTP
jgi:hypothetical protein